MGFTGHGKSHRPDQSPAVYRSAVRRAYVDHRLSTTQAKAW
jgi:hypothetical protein